MWIVTTFLIKFLHNFVQTPDYSLLVINLHLLSERRRQLIFFFGKEKQHKDRKRNVKCARIGLTSYRVLHSLHIRSVYSHCEKMLIMCRELHMWRYEFIYNINYTYKYRSLCIFLCLKIHLYFFTIAYFICTIVRVTQRFDLLHSAI